jgi:hypothetical protein
MVIAFDERVKVLSPPTNNRTMLQRAIRQAEFGDGTSLYEAVDHVINRELRKIEGRKAVVLFTDGVDTTSRRANYQTTVRAAEEIDALFYPIRYDTFNEMNGGYGGGTNYPQQRRRSSSGNILGDILGGILSGGNVQIGGGSSRSGGGSRSDTKRASGIWKNWRATAAEQNFEANNDFERAFSASRRTAPPYYSLGITRKRSGKRRAQANSRACQTSNAVVRAQNHVTSSRQRHREIAGRLVFRANDYYENLDPAAMKNFHRRADFSLLNLCTTETATSDIVSKPFDNHYVRQLTVGLDSDVDSIVCIYEAERRCYFDKKQRAESNLIFRLDFRL